MTPPEDQNAGKNGENEEKKEEDESEKDIKLHEEVNFYTHEHRWPKLLIEDS